MDRPRRRVALVVVGLVLTVVSPAVAGLIAGGGDADAATTDEGGRLPALATEPDALAPSVSQEGDATAPESGTGTSPPGDPLARQVTANESPTRLSLGAGARVSEGGTPTARLGAAVSVSDGGLAVRFDRYRARQMIAAADNESERRAAVVRILNATREAADRLRAREAAAVRAYHNGTADREELLRTLARVEVAASEYRRTLTEVQDRAGDVLQESALDGRLVGLDREMAAYQSPVRERIVAGLTARESGSVRVTTTQSGVAVEAIVGDQYVRDAVRLDRLATGGDGDPLTTPRQVVNRLRVLYPYAFQRATGSAVSTVSDRLFLAEFPHPQGQIRSYLNRDNGAVYREVQWLRLDRVPTAETVNRTVAADDVRVTVSRVNGSDPTRLTVTDTEGRPVEATVERDNETLAVVTDGGAWFVLGPTPAELTVRTERGVVNVTVGATASSQSSAVVPSASADAASVSVPAVSPSATSAGVSPSSAGTRASDVMAMVGA